MNAARLVVAALLPPMFAVATASCSAYRSDDDDGGDEVVSSSSEAVARKPICRLGRYRPETWTTARPRGAENVAAMQRRVDAANERARLRGDPTRYTLEDFGPYAHFKVDLSADAERSVEAEVIVLHVMPGAKELPPNVVWQGTIPAGVSGPLAFEMYYDAEQFGLHRNDLRYGPNHGRIDAECEGTRASQIYSFTRSRPR